MGVHLGGQLPPRLIHCPLHVPAIWRPVPHIHSISATGLDLTTSNSIISGRVVASITHSGVPSVRFRIPSKRRKCPNRRWPARRRTTKPEAGSGEMQMYQTRFNWINEWRWHNVPSYSKYQFHLHKLALHKLNTVVHISVSLSLALNLLKFEGDFKCKQWIMVELVGGTLCVLLN